MIQVFYPSKKALKESVGKFLSYEETSVHGPEFKRNGTFAVADGSPKRSWFAEVTMRDSKILKVK